MLPRISKANRRPLKQHTIVLLRSLKGVPAGLFTPEELSFIKRQHQTLKKDLIPVNRLDHWLFIQFIKEEPNPFERLEQCRKSGDALATLLNDQKIEKIYICEEEELSDETLALAEGMALGCYQFLKYRKEEEKRNTLTDIRIISPKIQAAQIKELLVVMDAVCRCRTFINEPYSYLNAEIFSDEIKKLAWEVGIKAEIFDRKRIETLKMGGILAVNRASELPPSFTVLEWNPAGAINKKPLVFVGKGIVFDSGGMNLKPGDSMSSMKDDMSGAAAVATAIYSIAKADLPVYIVGLIPVTDNTIGPKAIRPGDVIRMHNGMTVEVLNTDAEGRLILADALSFASKYKPELVIDLATLTGSAVRAIGKYGIVAMQVKAEKHFRRLTDAGWQVFERLVEFPSWDEYGELIKSDIADLKNLGPAEAGAITAGKFLEKFTDYPYIHLDIAGPAFLDKRDSYRGQGGTGVGVRLLFNFVKNMIHEPNS